MREKGLLCPKCGASLIHKLVNASRAQHGGHMRTRVCCGVDVVTFERVVCDLPLEASVVCDLPLEASVVTGVRGHDKGVVRRIVEALGGSMW